MSRWSTGLVEHAEDAHIDELLLVPKVGFGAGGNSLAWGEVALGS